MLDRRSLITGLISLVAAPAIVRAGSLMPIKQMLIAPEFDAGKIIIGIVSAVIDGTVHVSTSGYSNGLIMRPGGIIALQADGMFKPGDIITVADTWKARLGSGKQESGAAAP